jgi:signal transduction histidine kinase
VSVHDVSERHRVEELKQEFVSMITHDLRTPLASIQFTLELLSKKESTNLSEQWINRLASTQGSCTRLIGLINNLLDLEKLRSGKLDLGLEERPLNDIIERSLDSVRGFAEQQKVELQAPHTSAAVLADSERIVQVLVNLLSNAVKFSPSGQTVSVEASPVDSFVEVRVVDHGRGIPASKISEIFDRFAQVSRADAHVKGGGSGLGLTICKAIVEGHGGTIGVSSQEGNGSTFWFRIPRA